MNNPAPAPCPMLPASTGATTDRPQPANPAGASSNVPPAVSPGLPPAPQRRRPLALPAPELLAAALDQLDTGVLLLDGTGFVLLANDAARLEISEGGVLALDQAGQVHVGSAASLKALRSAIVAAVGEHLRQLLTLRAGCHSLTVAVQPLRVPGHAPLAMVLLQRRALCPDVVIEMLAGRHALTLAERRLLTGLLAGQRIADVAAANGVQVSTVRSQATALRQKFGVRRLEDLTRIAAELPPMAPALQGMFARWPLEGGRPRQPEAPGHDQPARGPRTRPAR